MISWKLLGILGEKLKNDTTMYILFCILTFGHYKLHSLYIALHMKVALKSQYLFAVGAKPFPAIQNVQYKCYNCAFQIFHFVPVVYFYIDRYKQCTELPWIFLWIQCKLVNMLFLVLENTQFDIYLRFWLLYIQFDVIFTLLHLMMWKGA